MTGARVGAGLRAGARGWVVGRAGLLGVLPTWVWVGGTSPWLLGTQPPFATWAFFQNWAARPGRSQRRGIGGERGIIINFWWGFATHLLEPFSDPVPIS